MIYTKHCSGPSHQPSLINHSSLSSDASNIHADFSGDKFQSFTFLPFQQLIYYLIKMISKFSSTIYFICSLILLSFFAFPYLFFICKVFVDGIDVRTIPLTLLRSRILTICQEPFLFSGCLRDNLDPEKYVHQKLLSLYCD